MIETKMKGVLKSCQSAYIIKFDTMETGGSTIGVPDTFYYCEQHRFHGWAEMKHVKSFDPVTIKIPWRPGQMAKGTAYARAGATVWLIVSADDTDHFMFIPAENWQTQYIRVWDHPTIDYIKHKKALNESVLMRILKQ